MDYITKPVSELFGVNSQAFAKMAVKVRSTKEGDQLPHVPAGTANFKFRESSLYRMLIWAASASLPPDYFGGAEMKKNLMIYGPTGCGKTKLLQEFCHRVKRPLFRAQCSEDMQASTLFGQWKLASKEPGAAPEMTYVPGAILLWAKTPNSVLLLDEVDQLIPTVFMALNAVLDGGEFFIEETSELVRPALGCLIAVTANSNGRGSVGGSGGSAALYRGVKRQNIASLDRFFVIHEEYLTQEEEKDLLLKSMPRLDSQIAEVMTRLASMIRKRFLGLHEDAGESGPPLEITITTRNLLNWAMSFTLMTTISQMDTKKALLESLGMTLLDFGTAAERNAVKDTMTNIIGA